MNVTPVETGTFLPDDVSILLVCAVPVDGYLYYLKYVMEGPRFTYLLLMFQIG